MTVICPHCGKELTVNSLCEHVSRVEFSAEYPYAVTAINFRWHEAGTTTYISADRGSTVPRGYNTFLDVNGPDQMNDRKDRSIHK